MRFFFFSLMHCLTVTFSDFLPFLKYSHHWQSDVYLNLGFRIPIIGGKELDLHRLFVEVTARGGIEKVSICD